MTQETQSAQIKLALKNGDRITPMDALLRFKCFRLGARIHELREEGMDITKEMVKRGHARVAEYRLQT